MASKIVMEMRWMRLLSSMFGATNELGFWNLIIEK
ncbi:hypothetical protein COLO4_00524 [Corchorus olitorius]|uniref:Uncharacterized protein n=1 Tax=Corchorus olitorius TaxID=93759 RepID=A0A1R3L3Q0_9ROSI|nr:hypothetical protein COLO4_00524 [Corchorus olitorius]